MVAAVVLDESFGITVLSVALLAFHYTMHGGLVGNLRGKLFKNKTLRESVEFRQLDEAHKRVFSTGLDELGFPDTGSGRVAALLSDEDWLRFNSAQRCHLHYLESMPLYLPCVFLCGLYVPIAAAVCAGLIIVGRTMFSYGYMTKGAPGRALGVGLATLAALTALGFAIYGAIGQLGAY